MQHEWSAPPEVKDHQGNPIGGEKRFQWGPPAEIGQVLSANSNIQHGEEPSMLKPWLIMGGITVGVFIAMGVVLPVVVTTKGDPTIIRILALIAGLTFGLLSLVFTWPAPPHCTYVGRDGIALLSGKWGSPYAGKSQILKFSDATVLFAATVHLYKNMLYTQTNFNFVWHQDPDGPPLMNIKGEHHHKDAPPPPDNLYHFAKKAEERWSQLQVKQLGPGVGRTRPLIFPCRLVAMKELRLYADHLEFAYKNRVDQVALANLGRIDAKKGVLRLDQHDASWFSDEGKFRVSYINLGNARVFIYYLSKVLAAYSK